MDSCKQSVIDKKIEKTIANLKANNMEAYFCRTKEDAALLAESLINSGDTIASGGSVSLVETGIMDLIKKKKYNYLDRAKEGITPEEIEQVYRGAFSADVYFTSANAITENGELYNVDGNGNRVAAMIYGPESVIVIAGYNKIVKDLDEAKTRVQSLAAPANAVRLGLNTPCTVTGKCMNCKSESRICADTVIMARQRTKDRIKVILVGEELGY